MLAVLPKVRALASYQDRSGLYVVHAADEDGIHEYTWRGGDPPRHGVLASLRDVLSVASYQDHSGTYVVQAATTDGLIHEYTWC
jgi:hypothetical protein